MAETAEVKSKPLSDYTQLAYIRERERAKADSGSGPPRPGLRFSLESQPHANEAVLSW
jgi:hypothetical protein